jgi:hypothetical protein
MPEIKNLFLQGKMNKDLDERLIPRGQYRHANNISVSYSEGADVGVAQNILGNTEISGGLTFPAGASCIGTVRDTENNKIYWFGTSPTADYIAELDSSNNSVDIILCEAKTAKLTASSNAHTAGSLVIEMAQTGGIISGQYVTGENIVPGTKVNTINSTTLVLLQAPSAQIQNGATLSFSNILNFNKQRFITGLSVLDGVLYFTDNLNEPRQVDIEYWRGVTATDFTTSTNLSEDRITVIKKSPLNAPTFATLAQSLRTGAGTIGGNAITFTKNFFTVNIDDTFNGSFSAAPNYQTGDSIELKNTFNGEFGNEIESILRIEITAYTSGTSFSAKLLSKTAEIQDAAAVYSCLLEEEEPLFELKFAKFSYRYKYVNGQFSTMAPFSLPAFIPGSFEYKAQEGYNLGMTNTVRKMELTGWLTAPANNNYQADIEEIEVLYKDSVSANIYIVEALKKTENNNTEFPANLQIKDEQIYKVIQSNQLLRSYDSVPKKAKALEITGNRLIFGNFEQDFNITTNPSFTTSIISRSDTSQKLSIKSGRTYQAGVIYLDQFGRQTPIFTDTSGVFQVNLSKSDLNSAIRIQTTHATLPADITHYKYYIKEASQPYYNLSVSNVYEDKETGYVYCSFPSSETNKVSAEDILILKKQTGPNAYKIASNSKFKVLDKDADPPNFLASKEKVLYEATNVGFSLIYGSGGTQITKKPGISPVPGHNTIQLDFANRPGDDSSDSCSSQFIAQCTTGAKFRFKRAGTTNRSAIYTIKSVSVEPEDGGNETELTFTEQFGEDVNVIYTSNSDTSTYTAALEFLQTEDDTGNPEYAGKFFIKLNNSSQLKQALIGEFDESALNTVATTVNFDAFDSSGENRLYMYTRVSTTTATIPAETHSDLGNYSLPAGFHIVIQSQENFGDGKSDYPTDPFAPALKVGNYIRFSGYSAIDSNFNDISEYPNYKITEVLTFDQGTGGTARKFYALKFNKLLEYNFPSTGENDANTTNRQVQLTVDIREPSLEGSKTPIDPPVFEIEPEEGVLDIYYETEETYAIAELGNAKTLNYANCFSFNNGVESDRIRDDFNAPTLGKGVRVSTVFEDNYKQDTLKNRLIFSGIYNSKNGVNRLNQFIIGEPITKDLNPEYGSIQKLHGRDTDLIALCEDRIIKILANKDALFNADGNPQLTATNRVLGQAIIPATFGAYGISKNPESFVDFTYRAYFTDKSRGKVLRLSMDGLTEISEYGMKDYFKDTLAAETGLILGTYDENTGQYNITFENQAETVSFSEGVKGWPSFKSFIPESGISLNNVYYTFKNGKLYSHTNSSRNRFYGAGTASSLIRFVLNDSPANIKNFRTLNYHGSEGWIVNSILTDQQDGFILSFVEKENVYYNYISAFTENAGSIDTKALNVQGLGNLGSTSLSGSVRTFGFNFELPNGIAVPDDLYYLNGSNKVKLGTITEVDRTAKTVKVDPSAAIPAAGNYMFYAKDAKFNTSGILGYYAEVTMSVTNTGAKELYTVGSEISLSS